MARTQSGSHAVVCFVLAMLVSGCPFTTGPAGPLYDSTGVWVVTADNPHTGVTQTFNMVLNHREDDGMLSLSSINGTAASGRIELDHIRMYANFGSCSFVVDATVVDSNTIEGVWFCASCPGSVPQSFRAVRAP